MVEVLKAHGSQNDLLLVPRPPDALADATALPALVRRLCDRSGPLGADGVYFVDAGSLPASAWFFNPDGSPSAFCGNGMRCVGRLLLDRYQVDTVRVTSGAHEFTVQWAEPTPEGVVQTLVELPPVDFAPHPPIVAGGGPHVDQPLPGLHPTLRFTALAVPNPHLVALVGSYDEDELVALGHRLAADRDTFPVGANLSFVLPLGEDEIFVRTFERGAGLTMSCGSGVVAARAACSRLGRFPPDRPVLVRNRGGTARAWLRAQEDRWYPHLEGNATFVFRATVDLAALAAGHPVPLDRAAFADETAAFAALDDANLQMLRGQQLTAGQGRSGPPRSSF